MNSEITLLQEACIKKITSHWPESQIIEILPQDSHCVDFLIKLKSHDVVILGKKTQKIGADTTHVNINWTASNLSKEALQTLLKAIKFEHQIDFIGYNPRRVFEKGTQKKHVGTTVSFTRDKWRLSWEHIFPNEPLPESAQWSVDKESVNQEGDYLVVRHSLKAGSAKQVHEYKLGIKHISLAVYDSTVAFKTFPFNIPHSHKIIENDEVTYDREMGEWEDHATQKGLIEDSNVQEKQCGDCEITFYDTSTQERCFSCLTKAQLRAKEEAIRLCETAEKHTSSDEWKEAAALMKALQESWKQLGSLPKDDRESLWERFNKATQHFFERQQAYYDELEQKRQVSKVEAIRLCESAEKHTTSDKWKETAVLMKELQESWKQLGSLPKDDRDMLWERFNKATQHFFERQQAHFDELNQKRQASKIEAIRLCEVAEKHATSDEWKETTALMKQQQENWKQLGSLPKDDRDTLWERFNKATQHFFERQQAYFDELNQKRQLNKKAAEALILKAKACDEITDKREAREKIKDLQAQWKNTAPLPKEDADILWSQFRTECQKFF